MRLVIETNLVPVRREDVNLSPTGSLFLFIQYHELFLLVFERRLSSATRNITAAASTAAFVPIIFACIFFAANL